MDRLAPLLVQEGAQYPGKNIFDIHNYAHIKNALEGRQKINTEDALSWPRHDTEGGD